MKQPLLKKTQVLLSFYIFITASSTISAKLDSTRLANIDTIEIQLRRDYQLCTHDSSEISITELLSWRKTIDSVMVQTNYAAITSKFFQETGLSPTNVRPCEIVTWIQTFQQQLQEYSEILDKSRDTVLQRYEDSLFLANDLSKVPKESYDLLGIPFGITQRSFLQLTSMYKKTISPKGDNILFDSLPYGLYTFRGAFHFSEGGIYTSYEIESGSSHFDSLNTVTRPIMLYMATHFETSTSRPPNHIYRVGQFDIVPGRLAICRLWTFTHATAYIGLARAGSRFYAKAIVRQE